MNPVKKQKTTPNYHQGSLVDAFSGKLMLCPSLDEQMLQRGPASLAPRPGGGDGSENHWLCKGNGSNWSKTI